MNFVIWLLLLSVAAVSMSCSDFSNKDRTSPREFDFTSGPFTEVKMLANIGFTVVAPATKELRLNIENLELAIDQLRAALGPGPSSSTAAVGLEKRVEEQWTKAMLVYHFLEALPVGPITDNNRAIADQIYGWPNFNPCAIDMEVVRLAESGKANPKVPFTATGLGALEYLFFEKSLSSQCNPLNPNYRTAIEWTRQDIRKKKLDRAQYAAVVVKSLLDQARRFEKAWDPAGANFAKVMIDGSRYHSIKEATIAMSDALFAVEEIKDRRLGRPLGLNKDCVNSQQKCPEAAEHMWSGLAIKAVAAQLEGLQAVFTGQRSAGAGGFGFDDLLEQMGHRNVSVRIVTAIGSAVEAAHQVHALGPLRAQIETMDANACQTSNSETRTVPACALFHDVRKIALLMKTEFLSVLSLRAPPKVQGDND